MKKIPRPTYLHLPSGYIDVKHRGWDFRIHIHVRCMCSTRFEVFNCTGGEDLIRTLSYEDRQRFRDKVAVWDERVTYNDDPDPEMPHSALNWLLDKIVDIADRKRVEKHLTECKALGLPDTANQLEILMARVAKKEVQS